MQIVSAAAAALRFVKHVALASGCPLELGRLVARTVMVQLSAVLTVCRCGCCPPQLCQIDQLAAPAVCRAL
jgi:hypothetical protein